MVEEGSWRAELDRWLRPFPAELNHAARRTMCPHYVAGLIGPGERKSMQLKHAAHGGAPGRAHWILLSACAFRAPDLYAGVILLGTLGYVSSAILAAMEKHILNWRRTGVE